MTELEYWLKLLPDFSVFDLVEKTYYDDNGEGWENNIKGLFYYNQVTDNNTFDSPFYRGFFKSDKEISCSDEDVIKFSFNLNGWYYLVIWNRDTTKTVQITAQTNSKVIGVAF